MSIPPIGFPPLTASGRLCLREGAVVSQSLSLRVEIEAKSPPRHLAVHNHHVNGRCSHALVATLLCRPTLGTAAHGNRFLCVGDSLPGARMSHRLNMHDLQRAHTMLLLSMLWAG